MPLDPQVQAVLDKIRDAGNPEYWQMTPQQARDWHNRKAGILDVKPEPVFKTSDRSVPGPAGGIPVRIFIPRATAKPLPVLVWLHGGGHVVGSLDSYDALCDAGGPKLVMQLLIYPRTAPNEDSSSHHEFAEGHLLTRNTILWFHRHYRSSDADRVDFRYAPLICKDLSHLPPALIIVGECDPLRDDGIAYAERLQRDGNAVELTNYPGVVHPFFSMGGAVDAGRRAMTQAASTLKRVFSAR